MMRIVIVAGQKGYLALRLVQRPIFEREGEEGKKKCQILHAETKSYSVKAKRLTVEVDEETKVCVIHSCPCSLLASSITITIIYTFFCNL